MTSSKRLTAAELAQRSGLDQARVDRLAEMGTLRSDQGGLYSLVDLQRAEIVAAYLAGGIDLEDIALALAERRITFEYSDRIYPPPASPTGRTMGDLTAELGAAGKMLPEVYMSLGLPRPDPARQLTDEDERVLRAFVTAWTAAGMPEDAPLRAARLLGEAMRRGAEGWVDLFMDAIALTVEERATMLVDELGPRMFEPATKVAQAFEPMAVWLLRRHLERALNAINVESMERALEAYGRRPKVAAEPAVVFADLSGFTRLAEEHGDELAVRHASTLSQLAMTAAEANNGRLVKQLGDGVMLAFSRVGPAIRTALALRSSAQEAQLPPLHMGISAGPVVERDGDYFGRTVNLASRISSIAGPGQIVATRTVVEGVEGLSAVPLGPATVKGLAAPVAVFLVEAIRAE